MAAITAIFESSLSPADGAVLPSSGSFVVFGATEEEMDETFSKSVDDDDETVEGLCEKGVGG